MACFSWFSIRTSDGITWRLGRIWLKRAETAGHVQNAGPKKGCSSRWTATEQKPFISLRMSWRGCAIDRQTELRHRKYDEMCTFRKAHGHAQRQCVIICNNHGWFAIRKNAFDPARIGRSSRQPCSWMLQKSSQWQQGSRWAPSLATYYTIVSRGKLSQHVGIITMAIPILKSP